MAVALVDSNSGSDSANTTNHVLTRPSGTATGNLLIAIVILSDELIVTAPAGWKPIMGFAELTGNDSLQQAWWRIAAGGDPSTWTFTTAGSFRAVFGMSAWSGHDPDRPIDAVDGIWYNGVSCVAPSLTAKRSGVSVQVGSTATSTGTLLSMPGALTTLIPDTISGTGIQGIAGYKACNAGGVAGENFGNPGAGLDNMASHFLINQDYTPDTLGSSAFAAAVMALSPAGYWRLADEVGLTADDWAGSNDGTYDGVSILNYGPRIFPALPASLQLGGASMLASTSGIGVINPYGRVTLPSVNWWSGGADVYTIMACFKLTEVSGRQTIFGASGTSGKPQIEVEADGSLDMIVEGAFRWDSAAGVISGNTPYFVVFTRNGAGNTFHCYLNGSEITDPSPSTTSQTTGAFVGLIGARTSTSQPAIGFISDVALFTTALSSANASALYALLTTTPPAGEPRFGVPGLIGG